MIVTCDYCAQNIRRSGVPCKDHRCNCTKPGAHGLDTDPTHHANYCVLRLAYAQPSEKAWSPYPVGHTP